MDTNISTEKGIEHGVCPGAYANVLETHLEVRVPSEDTACCNLSGGSSHGRNRSD